MLKRSFSLVCPCEAFSEPGKPDAPACVLARIAERFACQHTLKQRFSAPVSSSCVSMFKQMALVIVSANTVAPPYYTCS